MKQARHTSTTYGFKSATGLMQRQIRSASESRGFAQARLLTHWVEVVGEDVARICTPVKIGYPRQGIGAVLTLLTTGSQAPMLEMQKDRICDRVNACYGYRAVTGIRITQTAPTGFAEGQAHFAGTPRKAASAPDPATLDAARECAEGIENDDLRLALTALAANVLAKRKR